VTIQHLMPAASHNDVDVARTQTTVVPMSNAMPRLIGPVKVKRPGCTDRTSAQLSGPLNLPPDFPRVGSQTAPAPAARQACGVAGSQIMP
jgi:hypothetical protein